MKKIYTLLLFLVICNSNAQKKILEFKNSLKTSSSGIKDVIPIVNEENGDISIFIADAKNVYGYKFDENLKLIDDLSSSEKRRKFKTIVGNSISKNGDYTLYLTNKYKSKFLAVNFSFKDKKSTTKEYILNENEKFIQTVSYDNKFYLITGNKLKGILYFNTFNEKGDIVKNNIDTRGLSFVGKNDRKTKITNLLVSDFYGSIQKIEEDTPNSIENVAESRKLYMRDGNAVFTIDINKKFTQVLIVDLKTLKAYSRSYKKPLASTKSNRKKTNSYINGNTIFTIASTKEIFAMHILEYKTGRFLKEYAVGKDEKITFKNTPIIQEGGMYDNYRELDKTQKFLRKITAGKIGLSVIKSHEGYTATIGGFVEQQSGGMPMMGAFGGIALGAIGSATVFFNPTAFAYNSFSNTKSTRIECKFDKDFNHVKGEITKNVFDIINSSEISSANSKSKTIFKYKDYYIDGYYVDELKKYFLRKFTTN